MATSVGEIGLDLVINQKQYDKQLKGITSIAKKAGAALAAAFAVKKIADFGKDCIKLGSDLAEVQNVVDVTFSQMKTQVDEFAKSAAASFGLSETMAKKFTGTFGAMAKAFGFSESAAYDMGTTLTGLAGDVASFYNISQDEAYTKLKSVFTGETETLKDLGVVMTQNALDAYAMANGYGKTTQAMSEAEKVALWYAFVQNQLSAATGDFARTSDSWANQVRILSLQFDSLKATIGQGLINLFTPIIKVINTVIGKLATLANAFKSFTELLTGKKSGTSQVTAAGTAAEESLNSAAGAADSLSSATSGAGAAAKKATKEMKAPMGFDQINKLDDNSGGGSGGTSSGEAVDFGTLAEGETVIDKTDKSLNELIKRVKELAGIFKKGFQIGFGDSEKNIQKLKDSISSIGKNLKEIFTSKEVIDAANKWVESVVFSLGKITGSVAGVGVAIATNLVSGIAKSLEKKKGYIQAKISSILTINGESWRLAGDFVAAFGEIISSVLTSDAAVNITSDICSILTTGVLGGAELFLQAGLDLSSVLLQPIIKNQDKIKEAIVNTLKPVSEVIGTVKTGVEDAFLILKKAYDEHVAPTFQALREGVSDSFGKFLKDYNEHVAPVLSKLAKKFNEVYKGHIKPVLERIGELIGTVGDAIRKIYKQTLKPVVDWCVATIIPILMPIFETLGEGVLEAFGTIGDVFGGLIDIFSGVITFLTGIFTGDLEQVGEGIKEIGGGIADAFIGLISGIGRTFKKVFGPVADWFKKQFDKAVKNIKTVFAAIGGWFLQRYEDITGAFKDIHNWFKDKFRSAYTGIKNVFSSIGSWFKARYTSVTNAFKNVGAWFKEKFKSAYTSVTNAFSNIGAWFKARYQNITNVFKNIPAWFKSKFSSAWEGIKGVFSGVGDFFGGIWETIKSKFSTIGTSIGDTIGSAFKSAINAVLATVETVINSPIRAINALIEKVKSIPALGKLLPIGKLDTFNLPRLAQGGFVKANTPQLAMIGDNRHQGEVVAPEDKLKEMALEAVKMAGGGNSMTSEVVQLLKELITLVKELDLDVLLDGKSIKENTVNRINQHTKATGVCEII